MRKAFYPFSDHKLSGIKVVNTPFLPVEQRKENCHFKASLYYLAFQSS